MSLLRVSSRRHTLFRLSLVNMSGTVSRTGSLRIGALLLALSFLVAFLATLPALRDGFPFPYFRRVRSCCRHHFGASFLDLVGRLHCAPTRLVLHVHGAYLPPCTTSCCRCACSLMHPRGSPLTGALTVIRKRMAYSPGYTQLFGTPRISTPNPRDRPGPFHFPRCSHRWRLMSHRCP